MVDQPALPTLRGEGDAPSLSCEEVSQSLRTIFTMSCWLPSGSVP
jgi:hypothetical protein